MKRQDKRATSVDKSKMKITRENSHDMIRKEIEEKKSK